MNNLTVNTQQIISIRDISLLKPTKIKEVKKLVDKYMPDWNYKLPELENPKVKYLLGISGGVDSSALIAVLLANHPELYGRVTLLFSDTGNEPDSCYGILNTLEDMFGIPVVQLNDVSLFGEIEKNGGYLPSPKSRWCTSKLKIMPLNNYIKNNLLTDDKVHVISFSGLRWDERDRMGLIGLDNVTGHFLFIDQKIERPAVCSLANSLNLMSTAYLQGRSRSGCKNCFFSSKQELISLKIWDPKSFHEGETKEKVAEHILKRLSEDKKLNMRSSGFYTPYPVSELVTKSKDKFSGETLFGQERLDKEGTITWDYRQAVAGKAKRIKKSQNDNQIQLFSAEEDSADVVDTDSSISLISEEECILYVGVENYKHSMMLNDNNHGVWQQRLITFSRTLGGLSRALSGYHYHRQMASRGYFIDEDDYNKQSHITVIAIKFAKGIIPKIKYGNDSYTWASGRCYAELDYIIRCIDRASEFYISKKLVKEKRVHMITEQAERFICDWERDGKPEVGEICGIGHYFPKPIKESQFDSYEEDAKTIRCAICSI